MRGLIMADKTLSSDINEASHSHYNDCNQKDMAKFGQDVNYILECQSGNKGEQVVCIRVQQAKVGCFCCFC